MSAITIWGSVKPRTGEPPRLSVHNIDLSGERMRLAERVGELTAEVAKLKAQLDPPLPRNAEGVYEVTLGRRSVRAAPYVDIAGDIEGVYVLIDGEWMEPCDAFGDVGIEVGAELADDIEEQMAAEREGDEMADAASTGEMLRSWGEL